MKKILALLLFLISPASAQTPNGIINSPIYATGQIQQVGGTNVTTTIPANPNHPTNLNIITTGAITTWNIKLPNPGFDGQILSFACSATVTTISITTSDGSTVDSTLPTNCTTNSGFSIQYNSTNNSWRNATSTPFLNGINTWTLTYDNPAALAAATIPPTISQVEVTVVAGTPSSPAIGTCGLRYQKGTSTPTGVYGEVLNTASGIYWEPQYETSPRKGCQYGMVGNYSTDNSTALQAAINDTLVNGGELYIAPGKFIISSTINFGPAVYKPINFHGASQNISNGYYGTTFVWRGISTNPIFNVQGLADSTFSDFAIYSEWAASALIQSTTISGYVSTHNSYTRVMINGNSLTPIGFRFVAGSGGDANNDLNLFLGVAVYYTTSAAWSFEHAQSVVHTLLNCETYFTNISVATSLGPSGYGGSFMWLGGLTLHNAVADFQIGKLTGSPMEISGVHSEASARFVQMVGGAAIGAKPFIIRNVDWSSANLAVDKYAIVLNGAGPFTLEGLRLGGNGAKIQLNSSTPATLRMTGNDFPSIGSNAQASIVDTTGGGTFYIIRTNNIYADGAGNPAFRSDDLTSESGMVTVGTLPACAAGTAGMRIYVNDSTQTLTAGIGAVVAGGGGNTVPVGCDGTNWRIGG